MSTFTLYLVCLIVPLVFGLAVQGWLRNTFARNSKVPVGSGKTGAEVAREILDRNGLHGVPVQLSKGGALSDHYDPRSRGLALSEPVYKGRSVAATAVAAHEVGHAIQHSESYVPMTIRSAIWPVAAFASQAWFFLLLGGLFLNLFGLVQLAIILYAAAVVFQIVTLPVELNASRRAAAQLQQLGLVTGGEAVGVRKTLTAAAMTYVAAALAALAQLLYFVTLFGRN